MMESRSQSARDTGDERRTTRGVRRLERNRSGPADGCPRNRAATLGDAARTCGFPPRPRLALLGIFLLAAASALAQSPHTHQHSFSGAEQWSRYFDDPARDAWQKPHQVIEALDLRPGAKVADIGAGTGYFAVRLAHMAAQGRVYAVDIEPDMVKYLAERAAREKLGNVRAVLASPSDPKLPEQVDRVLVVDTYHHINERRAYFRRLLDYLRPGAEVAIIDFTRASPTGPPVSERLSPEQVIAEMKDAGYRLVRSPTFLPQQYFLVFAAR